MRYHYIYRLKVKTFLILLANTFFIRVTYVYFVCKQKQRYSNATSKYSTWDDTIYFIKQKMHMRKRKILNLKNYALAIF